MWVGAWLRARLNPRPSPRSSLHAHREALGAHRTPFKTAKMTRWLQRCCFQPQPRCPPRCPLVVSGDMFKTDFWGGWGRGLAPLLPCCFPSVHPPPAVPLLFPCFSPPRCFHVAPCCFLAQAGAARAPCCFPVAACCFRVRVGHFT